VIILIAALVIFGPSKLPELGKSLGQGIREFKKATQAITEEVTKAAMDEPAAKPQTAEAKPQIAEAKPEAETDIPS
jgi:sec-independent protein translocase protein TatA